MSADIIREMNIVNTFWRYFIHSILITASLSIAIMFIALISPEMELSLPIVIVFLVGCVYFSFGMALVCNERSELITLFIKNDNETALKIKEIIINEVGKKEIVEENENITRYYNKTKYLKWLTNETDICEYWKTRRIPEEII